MSGIFCQTLLRAYSKWGRGQISKRASGIPPPTPSRACGVTGLSANAYLCRPARCVESTLLPFAKTFCPCPSYLAIILPSTRSRRMSITSPARTVSPTRGGRRLSVLSQTSNPPSNVQSSLETRDMRNVMLNMAMRYCFLWGWLATGMRLKGTHSLMRRSLLHFRPSFVSVCFHLFAAPLCFV